MWTHLDSKTPLVKVEQRNLILILYKQILIFLQIIFCNNPKKKLLNFAILFSYLLATFKHQKKSKTIFIFSVGLLITTSTWIKFPPTFISIWNYIYKYFFLLIKSAAAIITKIIIKLLIVSITLSTCILFFLWLY